MNVEIDSPQRDDFLIAGVVGFVYATAMDGQAALVRFRHALSP